MDEQEYTTEEVAKMLRVSPVTVRSWIKKGHLAARRSGPTNRSPFLVARSDVQAMAYKVGIRL